MEFLNANSTECSVVLFFTAWCQFSASLAPHFNALPRVFPSMHFLALDASQHSRYIVVNSSTFKIQCTCCDCFMSMFYMTSIFRINYISLKKTNIVLFFVRLYLNLQPLHKIWDCSGAQHTSFPGG